MACLGLVCVSWGGERDGLVCVLGGVCVGRCVVCMSWKGGSDGGSDGGRVAKMVTVHWGGGR